MKRLSLFVLPALAAGVIMLGTSASIAAPSGNAEGREAENEAVSPDASEPPARQSPPVAEESGAQFSDEIGLLRHTMESYYATDWQDQDSLRKSATEMETILRRLVLVAFNELGDFESVQDRLEGVVTFQQVPRGTFDTRFSTTGIARRAQLPGFEELSSGELTEKSKLPKLLYWVVNSRKGNTIYVLEHSRLNFGIMHRDVTAPFFITERAGRFLMSEMYEPAQSDIKYIGRPPRATVFYFLDYVDTGSEYPTLATIHYGVAQVVDLSVLLYDFDLASKKWIRSKYERITPPNLIDEVYYDSEKQVLNYVYFTEGERRRETGKLRVADLARK